MMDLSSKGSAKFPIFRGSVARRVLLRSLLIAAAMSVVPLVHVLSGPYLKMFAPICAVRLGQSSSNFTSTTWFIVAGRHLSPIWSSVEPKIQCDQYSNLTREVVRELTEKKLLNPIGARSLCVGEGSLQAAKVLQDSGFPDAQYAMLRSQRFFRPKKLVHEINRRDKSFDFVLSTGLDMASVPALMVLEIERVLSPGGVGAVLVGTPSGTAPNSLIRSATPISSVLKTSSIVHVNRIENLTLVVFKKRVENVGYFEQYRLPADCPSVLNNRAFVAQMEPLAKQDKNFSYLPNFVNFSSKKRLVYVDIGSGKHLNSNAAASMHWFPPKYPIDQKAFSVYFVDHNTSVMLSYVRNPGITFVYHPGLSGTVSDEAADEDSGPYMGNIGFDFLAWFKETSQNADFVVLKMNAGNVEMKFLSELFESGGICYVDELFLHCPGLVDSGGVGPVGCVDLLKDLRNSGVFVHQWWGDYEPTSSAW